MKDLISAMNIVGDEEENDWDVDDQMEIMRQRVIESSNGGTITDALTEQIKNLKQEEPDKPTSGFDAESFFAIGTVTPDPNVNPFSQESLQSVEEKLKSGSNTEGGAHSVSSVVLDSVSQEELELFRQTASSTESKDVPFEVISEPESPTSYVTIEQQSNHTTLDVVSGDEAQKVNEQELKQQEINHLEQLASVAEIKDPNEIAEMVNPNKTNIVSVDSASNSIIIVDEDDDSDEVDYMLSQQDISSYVAEIAVVEEEVQSQKQPESQPQIVVEEEETRTVQEPTKYEQQYQEPTYYEQTYEQPTHTEPMYQEPTHIGQSSLTGIGVQTFNSRFGEKYRGSQTMNNNGHILDLSQFEDNKSVTGDVYVQRVTLATYGKDNKKRVDYEFLLMNKAKIRGAQFNMSQEVTQEQLNELVGKVFTIGGKWNTYRNSKQINVESITLSQRTTPDMFEVSEAPILEQWMNIFMNELQTDWIRELVGSILYTDGMLDRMKQTPAAITNHDTSRDGLFLHTMKVTMHAMQSARLYPNVNHEVVIAGSLLHDIGKVYEIGDNGYTEFGISTGHIVIGHSIVRDRLNDLKRNGFNIDNRTSQNILHCILSHHGKLEYGSPVEPVTREAWIVHFSDSMDTYVTHIDEHLPSGEKQVFSPMTKKSILDLN